MGKNQLHSFWPVLVGEFFNPEHNLIKDEFDLHHLLVQLIFFQEIHILLHLYLIYLSGVF